MRRDNDPMVGRRFGHLVVLEAIGGDERGRMTYLCRCDCGKEAKKFGIDLRAGRSVSCGRDCTISRKTHPQNRTRIYWIWHGMKNRCGNQSKFSCCEEWKNFPAFCDWAFSHGYRENAPRGACTLDRINTAGDYSPDNCRFIDLRSKNHNRRISDPDFEQFQFLLKVYAHIHGEEYAKRFKEERLKEHPEWG